MESALRQHIAASVRAARRRKGLSQEELASEIGRTPESLSNIERSHSLPSLVTLMRIADTLGTQISDLLPATGKTKRRKLTDQRLEEEVIQVVRELDGETLVAAKLQLEALSKLRRVRR